MRVHIDRPQAVSYPIVAGERVRQRDNCPGKQGHGQCNSHQSIPDSPSPPGELILLRNGHRAFLCGAAAARAPLLETTHLLITELQAARQLVTTRPDYRSLELVHSLAHGSLAQFDHSTPPQRMAPVPLAREALNRANPNGQGQARGIAQHLRQSPISTCHTTDLVVERNPCP